MKHSESIEFEIGKYYALNPDKFYFSINLQRSVKFINPVIVKVTNTSTLGLIFGTLVDVGLFEDINTTNEIEFISADILREYEFKKYNNTSLKLTPFYMEFKFD